MKSILYCKNWLKKNRKIWKEQIAEDGNVGMRKQFRKQQQNQFILSLNRWTQWHLYMIAISLTATVIGEHYRRWGEGDEEGGRGERRWFRRRWEGQRGNVSPSNLCSLNFSTLLHLRFLTLFWIFFTSTLCPLTLYSPLFFALSHIL